MQRYADVELERHIRCREVNPNSRPMSGAILKSFVSAISVKIAGPMRCSCSHQDGGLHSRFHAFVARSDQGVTYGMNVWHHSLCVLDRPGHFAVFMRLDDAAATKSSSICRRHRPSRFPPSPGAEI